MTDNQMTAIELAFGQIWEPKVAGDMSDSRVVESVCPPGQVAFTLRSRSGHPLATPREVITREDWDAWVETHEAELSGMTYPCLKRIILHELGHLVVDLVLAKYIGFLTIKKTATGYDARVDLTGENKNQRKGANDAEDLVFYCASAYGGWAAVKFGIEKQVDNSLITTGDIIPGFEGFTGSDAQIISTTKRDHGSILPKDLERVAFEKAQTVIEKHFDLIWKVTQRLEKEVNAHFHANPDVDFTYSQNNAYEDFASLIT